MRDLSFSYQLTLRLNKQNYMTFVPQQTSSKTCKKIQFVLFVTSFSKERPKVVYNISNDEIFVKNYDGSDNIKTLYCLLEDIEGIQM